MQLAEGFKERGGFGGLGGVFDDAVDGGRGTAGDYQHVVFFEVFVRVGVVDVGFYG